MSLAFRGAIFPDCLSQSKALYDWKTPQMYSVPCEWGRACLHWTGRSLNEIRFTECYRRFYFDRPDKYPCSITSSNRMQIRSRSIRCLLHPDTGTASTYGCFPVMCTGRATAERKRHAGMSSASLKNLLWRISCDFLRNETPFFKVIDNLTSTGSFFSSPPHVPFLLHSFFFHLRFQYWAFPQFAVGNFTFIIPLC